MRDEASRERALLLGLCLAAAVGVVLVVFHVDYFPTLDGPHHLFVGYLENHFDDAGAGWHDWLVRGAPFTALGFHLVFSTAERFLGWRTAFQVTLVILALVWGSGHVVLARAVHPRRAVMGLVGFATSIPWIVHMGFFSFAISVALGLFTIAIAARAWPWTWKRRAVLAALLFVQAVSHAFGAELTGVVLLAIVAIVPEKPSLRDRAREMGLLALTGLPALVIAATATNEASGPTGWLSLADHLRVLPRTFQAGPLWRAWPPLLLGVAGVVVTAVRARAKEASRVEIALAVAAGLHLVLAFVTPMDLAAWQLFAPRFLPFGCLLGAALLPVERLGEGRRLAATAGLAALAAASLVWTARTAAALRAREDEAFSGLSAPLHRTGARLVVSVDAFAAQEGSEHQDIPYYAPLFYLGPLYSMTQGGIPPFGFLNNPRIHPFVFSEEGRKRYPPLFNPANLLDLAGGHLDDPSARAKLVTFLAMVGAPFEDIVLHGRPEDGDVLIQRGYVADFRNGGLFIGHLEGCPVTVRVVTSEPGRVLLDYAPEPLLKTSRRAALGDKREVRIAPWPCGPMWVRAGIDRDGSGRMPKQGPRCEGADVDGRLRFVAGDRGGQVVECRLGP